MDAPDDGARTTLLLELLNLANPLPEILKRLRELPWGCDPLVQIRGAHLEAVLRRYLAGSVDGFEVEAWANVIEARDDIEWEPAREALLRETLRELANPMRSRPLSRDSAEELLRRLADGG